jgi:hypothetical protein
VAAPHHEEERRRLFRRMEWLFVFGPPIAALFIAVFGALFIAWLLPLGGTTFWGRWLIVFLILIGIPLLGHLIQRLRE